MAFYEGSTIEMSAWYFVENNGSKRYLFLMDLEESTAIGAGPGIRIGLDEDEALFLERKKYIQADIKQAQDEKIKFPKDQWVEIKMVVQLSQKKDGRITLYQDGELLIDAKDIQTLPTDYIYIIQGSAGLYTNIEFGITANSIDSETILYLDEVEVKTIE